MIAILLLLLLLCFAEEEKWKVKNPRDPWENRCQASLSALLQCYVEWPYQQVWRNHVLSGSLSRITLYLFVFLVLVVHSEPTKISRRYLESGSKVRISKLTGHEIPKPDPLADRRPRSIVVGMKDTMPDDVTEVTFPDYEKYVPYIYKNYVAKREAQNATPTKE